MKAQRPLPSVRCTAQHIAGTTRFRFTCTAGHTFIEDVNKGKPKHLHLPVSSCLLLAGPWAKMCYAYCKQCFKGTQHEK